MTSIKNLVKTTSTYDEILKSVRGFISTLLPYVDFYDYYGTQNKNSSIFIQNLCNKIIESQKLHDTSYIENEFIDDVLEPLNLRPEEFERFRNIVRPNLTLLDRELSIFLPEIVEQTFNFEDLQWRLSIHLECYYKGKSLKTLLNGKEVDGIFIRVFSEDEEEVDESNRYDFDPIGTDKSKLIDWDLLGYSSNSLDREWDSYDMSGEESDNTYELTGLLLDKEIRNKVLDTLKSMISKDELVYSY